MEQKGEIGTRTRGVLVPRYDLNGRFDLPSLAAHLLNPDEGCMNFR
jgi:hypothetical protein